MHALSEFVTFYGAEIALAAGMFLILLWGLSADGDPSDESTASMLRWWAFWPVIWVYFWLTGRSTGPRKRRIVPSNVLTVKPQVGAREQSAQRFRTIREAKDYLAGEIAREGERSGAALTEVERKMLYFTETGWTLPDMKEVSSEFDRDYDQSAYEQKVASIVSGIRARCTDEHQQERMAWERAIEKLSEGDHYLLVLVNAANPARKRAKNNLKMLIAFLISLALAALDVWFKHFMLRR